MASSATARANSPDLKRLENLWDQRIKLIEQISEEPSRPTPKPGRHAANTDRRKGRC